MRAFTHPQSLSYHLAWKHTHEVTVHSTAPTAPLSNHALGSRAFLLHLILQPLQD